MIHDHNDFRLCLFHPAGSHWRLGSQRLRRIHHSAGYKPLAGEAALGEKLFNDTKLSTNGMKCASCHASPGAFQFSFDKPYAYTASLQKTFKPAR